MKRFYSRSMRWISWLSGLAAGAVSVAAAVEVIYTEPAPVIYSRGDVNIYNGGFGSGMDRHPTDPNVYYLMTDRGPNFDATNANVKIFPKSDFAPQIGVFRKQGNQLKKESVITLKNAAGKNLSGLPNPAGEGGTGEKAVDLDGNELPFDVEGIDPEGLVALPDGTFWISDEYGPHIIHIDAAGRTLERINPFGNGLGGRKLPKVLGHRQPNRGMEGLTITPDGARLVGVMQSALDNPNADRIAIRRNSRATRLLVYEIATGKTQQYIYLQEQANLSNSEIRAISNTEFVILERDGAFPRDPTMPAAYKRFYKIDITGATDVSDPEDKESGLMFNFGGTEKTLEQMTTSELLAVGITPVTKEIYLDLLRSSPIYVHDKPEAFVILGPGKLAVINDDDFGIGSNNRGGILQKVIPGTSDLDRNVLHIVEQNTTQR